MPGFVELYYFFILKDHHETSQTAGPLRDCSAPTLRKNERIWNAQMPYFLWLNSYYSQVVQGKESLCFVLPTRMLK